jgi:hypothetical protein
MVPWKQIGAVASGFLMAGLLMMGSDSAWGALGATATISATPSGPSFNYTIMLTNTGTTNIGTFWFAWTPPGAPVEYDFLPSAPSSITQPAGWVGLSSFGFPGYSIESYNLTGSLIAPGQTGIFQFASSDSPATLQGTSIFEFPITTSFIYEGPPEVGATAEVTPVFVVPEPASLGLVVAGGLTLLVRPRRRQALRSTRRHGC